MKKGVKSKIPLLRWLSEALIWALEQIPMPGNNNADSFNVFPCRSQKQRELRNKDLRLENENEKQKDSFIKASQSPL